VACSARENGIPLKRANKRPMTHNYSCAGIAGQREKLRKNNDLKLLFRSICKPGVTDRITR